MDRKALDIALLLIEENQTNEELFKKVGSVLYNALFDIELSKLFSATMAGADHTNSGVRLRLVFEDPRLASLPWELLYDESTNIFLANDPKTALSRYIDLPSERKDIRPASLPLKILLVISSPRGMATPDPEKKVNLIRNALKEHIRSGQIEIDVLTKATIDEIDEKLNEKPYNVFHFIGPGVFKNEKGHVVLVDEDDSPELLDDQRFANLFLGKRGLGLVLLNACEGGAKSSNQVFAGMAPRLVQRGIPAVIAMQFPIEDCTANFFADRFYRNLAFGKPVDEAVQSTRNYVSIKVGQDKRDFATPVLYMRARDGVILDISSLGSDLPINDQMSPTKALEPSNRVPGGAAPKKGKMFADKRTIAGMAVVIVAILVIASLGLIITNNGGSPLFDYREINGNTEVEITGYHGSGGNLVLPSVIAGEPTTSIGSYAFSHSTTISSLTIPSTVTSIGSYAFSYCISLSDLTLSNTVTSIGSNAFSYCTSLIDVFTSGRTASSLGHEVNIETSIKVIRSSDGLADHEVTHSALLGASTLSVNVSSVGHDIFNNCTKLTSVSLPDGLTEIGNHMFSNCTSLTSITVPANVTSIGNDAFSNCTSLTNMTIPSNVVSIGSCAFYQCTNLTRIIMDGDAPPCGDRWIGNHNANLTIYYYGGNKGFGDSGWTGVRTVCWSIPAAPTNVSVAAGRTYAKIGWEPPPVIGNSTVQGYEVFYGAGNNASIMYGGMLSPSSLSANITGLVQGTDYCFAVKAKNAFGEGPLSDLKRVTTSTNPQAPHLVSAIPNLTSVRLNWTKPIDTNGTTITGYEVMYGTDNVSTQFAGMQSNSSNGIIVDGLSSGTVYQFGIIAVSGSGDSVMSNVLTVTTLKNPKAPHLDAAVPSLNSVHLNWTGPIDTNGTRITGYKVMYGMVSANNQFGALQPSSSNSITVTGLSSGTIYFFGVIACNGSFDSVISNILSATTLVNPNAPHLDSAIPGISSVQLHWTMPKNTNGTRITGYKVMFGTANASGQFGVLQPASSTGVNVTGLSSGLTYQFGIIAVSTSTDSPISNTLSASPCTVPSAPNNLSANSGTNYTVLRWKAPLSDGHSPIIGYKVFYRLKGNFTQFGNLIPVNITLANITNLSSFTTYGFAVKAVNAIGDGPLSNLYNATTHEKSDFDYVTILISEKPVRGLSMFRQAIRITGYHGRGGNVTIPNTLDGKPVTSIGASAFNRSTTLTAITIPSSVNSIGSFAFRQCTSLREINVDPKNSYYASDHGVLFNKSMTVLIQCPGGKTGAYDLPNNVTSIGAYAFYNCTSLTWLSMPTSLTMIGAYALSGCPSINQINFTGNAPECGPHWIMDHNPDLIILIKNGATGFDTSAWQDLDVQAAPTYIIRPLIY